MAGGVLGVLATVVVLDAHRSHVSPLDPGPAPERVTACGRTCRMSAPVSPGDVDTPDPVLGSWAPVGESHPLLHEPVTVLGHPRVAQCGAVVLVTVGDGRPVRYTLLGGP